MTHSVAISLLHMAAILHKHYYHADGQFVAWVALENCKERAKGFIHMFLANVQCLPVSLSHLVALSSSTVLEYSRSVNF